MYMYAYYIHTLHYIHNADTYMTAVCMDFCMIMFNVYITASVSSDGCARAATLIADSSYSDY